MSIATRHRTSLALVLLPILPAGLLAAAVIGATPHGHAASPAQRAPEHFTIRASALHLPGQIPAGIVAITLVNDTKVEVDASMAQVNPGATLAQINAASAAANGNSADSLAAFVRLTHLVTFMGGVSSISPGATETAIVDLRTPGLHGLHIGANNGPGRTAVFTVTPGAGQQETLPRADLTVRYKDMKFLGLPRHLATGQITIKAINQGPSVHEMAVVRLDAGKTQGDVLARLRSSHGQDGPPAWAHPVGGIDLLSPHQSAEVTLRLTPGYYLAICFMPDAKKQLPHVMEGMIGNFTVR